ncbi:SART-1 family [Cryptosporidium sp. chipmunk genotype I]|uniref:SART-1 family n=1 Tax=Cryptosporidium sp. chipmunk genotype I TaxID=1280935 RepID=UPI003519FEF3|nr:SART-1 family [Cryptosporidium sp. chipmunk genotype I]
MSKSVQILDKFEQGKIITFEDKHILEYKDEEDDCDQLNTKIHLNNMNFGPKNNSNNDDFGENNGDKFKFKRTKIKVIKKNLRETNYELINDEERNSSNINSNSNNYTNSNIELTNFNTNFLTNDNSIFDDTSVFYDRIKIQKKRKTLQNVKNEFESQSDANLKNEENPNYSESNIYLSLETEFCRKIDNNNVNDVLSDSINNNTITKTKMETLYSDSLNQDSLYELQNTFLKQEDSKDNFKKTTCEGSEMNAESDNKTQNNFNDNILYEEPLDFGISSTLALLQKRGEISSSNKEESTTLNKNEIDQKYENHFKDSTLNSELDFQVSIFHTDDNGNILNPKDAFKRLCWKFHGQKINKNKIEKMLRNHLRNKT